MYVGEFMQFISPSHIIGSVYWIRENSPCIINMFSDKFAILFTSLQLQALSYESDNWKYLTYNYYLNLENHNYYEEIRYYHAPGPFQLYTQKMALLHVMMLMVWWISLQSIDSGKNSSLVSLCLCLGLLGRRALGTAAHNNTTAAG